MGHLSSAVQIALGLPLSHLNPEGRRVADREGFEPSVLLLAHTLSKRARSTTLPPVLWKRFLRVGSMPWVGRCARSFAARNAFHPKKATPEGVNPPAL